MKKIKIDYYALILVIAFSCFIGLSFAHADVVLTKQDNGAIKVTDIHGKSMGTIYIKLTVLIWANGYQEMAYARKSAVSSKDINIWSSMIPLYAEKLGKLSYPDYLEDNGSENDYDFLLKNSSKKTLGFGSKEGDEKIEFSREGISNSYVSIFVSERDEDEEVKAVTIDFDENIKMTKNERKMLVVVGAYFLSGFNI